MHFRIRHGIEKNLYVIAMERQMNYLRSIIEDQTTNFRHKLKRGDQKKLHEFRGNLPTGETSP